MWLSGLNIWSCDHSGSGCCCGPSLIPGPATSACQGFGRKKRKKKKKKKERKKKNSHCPGVPSPEFSLCGSHSVVTHLEEADAMAHFANEEAGASRGFAQRHGTRKWGTWRPALGLSLCCRQCPPPWLWSWVGAGEGPYCSLTPPGCSGSAGCCHRRACPTSG